MIYGQERELTKHWALQPVLLHAGGMQVKLMVHTILTKRLPVLIGRMAEIHRRQPGLAVTSLVSVAQMTGGSVFLGHHVPVLIMFCV
jgi:hypothetical protein